MKCWAFINQGFLFCFGSATNQERSKVKRIVRVRNWIGHPFILKQPFCHKVSFFERSSDVWISTSLYNKQTAWRFGNNSDPNVSLYSMWPKRGRCWALSWVFSISILQLVLSMLCGRARTNRQTDGFFCQLLFFSVSSSFVSILRKRLIKKTIFRAFWRLSERPFILSVLFSCLFSFR